MPVLFRLLMKHHMGYAHGIVLEAGVIPASNEGSHGRYAHEIILLRLVFFRPLMKDHMGAKIMGLS
jgi:hypothetical protein